MHAAVALQDVDGSVVIAAVCDEEAGGIGTRALLDAGEQFDGAIVTEPTDLDIVVAHKGFVGFSSRRAAAPRTDPGPTWASTRSWRSVPR